MSREYSLKKSLEKLEHWLARIFRPLLGPATLLVPNPIQGIQHADLPILITQSLRGR